MEEIKRQVAKAQWRLNLNRFLGALAWSLFATLLVAAIGVAIPKIWVLNVDAVVWTWSWIGGGVALGFVIAVLWTWLVRRSSVEAAIEIDRRFGLKERISSSLTLTEKDLETEAGRALVEDATRRVETIDVTEQFQVAPQGRVALPLVPALAIALVAIFLTDAAMEQSKASTSTAVAIEKEIKKTQEDLKKKLAERKKDAQEKDLKDAEALFKTLEEAVNKDLASKDPLDQKKAMIKLNDLTKELQDRKDKLGGADKVKEQLSKLKDIQQGPAEKAIKAMQEGNFDKAQQEMKKVQEQLKNGELKPEEQKKLGEQLEQMQKKVEEIAKKHEAAKQELQEQIKEAEKQGDREKAGKLQQKLDAMKNADKQMDKLQQMADKLGQAAEAAKKGDAQAAAQQLDQLAQDMKEMQKDLDNLQMVDEMMNEVAQAKNGLCEACEGLEDGMEGEEGNGKGKGKKKGGRGLGEGEGVGDRPEEKTDTGKFDSQVRAKPKKGEAVRTGSADGPNIAGRTSAQVKDEINATKVEEDQPLTDQRLPKSQREHAREYFERLRDGK